MLDSMMRTLSKQISGSPQPDGSGVQFIYLNDGRLLSSARIVGNITDEEMLGMRYVIIR